MVTCFHNNENICEPWWSLTLNLVFTTLNMWEILPDQIGQVFGQKQQQRSMDVVENDYVLICF